MKRRTWLTSHCTLMSPPVRGAWIETSLVNLVILQVGVAPRAGGVD